MPWTLTHEDNAVVHVRAVIDLKTQSNEIRDLITALEKRLSKENTDERTPVADV